jgi:hypothetical protein
MHGYGYYQGYGANTGDGGAVVLTPPEAPPAVSGAAYVTVDGDGYRFVNKQVEPLLMQTLKNQYGVTFLGGEFNNVKLTAFTPEQLAAAQTSPEMKAIIDSMNAKAWIDQQVADGQVVFASMATLVALASGQSLAPGSDQLGTFPEKTPEAKEAGKSPLGVILGGHPEGKGFLAMLGGPLGIALGVGVVAAVGYIVLTRKKRGGSAGVSARM